MKTVVLQVADQGPLESLVLMLEAADYRCYLPSDALRKELRSIGCDTVLSPYDLKRQFGYDLPVPLPITNDPSRCDLFVDVKGHRSYEKLVRRWPSMEGKVLWYRINGGKPEIVPGCGDEVNPPCPVLTPNQWYKDDSTDRAYAFWPRFYRFDDYNRRKRTGEFSAPVCLIHNLRGWGYGALVESMRQLGVRMYGAGSPDGLVQHSEIPSILRNALCMVHLKSNDAPGYALYEAMASACPVVCTRRLIWRCRMQDLLAPGNTCFVFDRETHDGLTEQDVQMCTKEVTELLEALRDPEYNRRYGEAGRERLKEIMWRPDRDLASFKAFLSVNFPA